MELSIQSAKVTCSSGYHPRVAIYDRPHILHYRKLNATTQVGLGAILQWENISGDEIKVAIHTDSRHADRLRSLYASKEALEQGFVQFRRIDFVGSRRHLEALKRINGQNNCNCYELLLRA